MGVELQFLSSFLMFGGVEAQIALSHQAPLHEAVQGGEKHAYTYIAACQPDAEWQTLCIVKRPSVDWAADCSCSLPPVSATGPLQLVYITLTVT